MNTKGFSRPLFSLLRLTPTQRAKVKDSIKPLDDESGVPRSFGIGVRVMVYYVTDVQYAGVHLIL